MGTGLQGPPRNDSFDSGIAESFRALSRATSHLSSLSKKLARWKRPDRRKWTLLRGRIVIYEPLWLWHRQPNVLVMEEI